jgi:sugar lactone lactonase YvrE
MLVALAVLPAKAQPVLLVSNRSGSVVQVIGGEIPTTYASGFNIPLGMAVDPAKNLYVATFDNGGSIMRVTTSGSVSLFASVPNPIGLAIDGAGNLYAASGGSMVTKITPTGGVSTFAAGFSGAYGLAFDGNGDLYVANNATNTVSKVTPDGSVSTFASGFNGPRGLAVDASGNVYVADSLNNLIARITPSGSVGVFATLSSAGIAGDRPEGLTFGSDGNLYVACNGSDILKKITPSGVVTSVNGNFDLPGFVVPSPIPEPSTLVLVGAAAALAFFRRPNSDFLMPLSA